MKQCIRLLICALVVLVGMGAVPISGTEPAELPFDVNALSAVLMDAETGEILYAKIRMSRCRLHPSQKS